jgi:hypothetical protein
MEFRNQCFVSLDPGHVATKIEALRKYESQGHRTYTSEEFINSLARVRGVQSGNQLAEVFEVHRLMI